MKSQQMSSLGWYKTEERTKMNDGLIRKSSPPVRVFFPISMKQDQS